MIKLTAFVGGVKMKHFAKIALVLAAGLALWGCQSPTSSSSTAMYTVTYSANGATSGTAPTDSNSYAQGTTVTVLGNPGGLTMSGYSFGGWNTQANGSGTTYSQGSTFTMGAGNVTLYAVWSNQTGGTITITQPASNTVTISGSTTLSFGQSYTFTSTYTGSAKNYQWYLNGTAISGATLASFTLTPTISTVPYGANLLTISITDASGLAYSGALTVNVGN
jgi:hypothetical protein